MTMNPDNTALVVIDVQKAFSGYDCFERVADGTRKLVAGAQILGLPVVVTEQYPQGLGETVPEVGLPEGAEPIAKTAFSAMQADGFREQLGDPEHVLICGIETHVCVAQTVRDLIWETDDDPEVHVVVDAVGSRHQLDHDIGVKRMDDEGASLTTVEAALLELCGRAGTPEFKEVQGLIV